jgi:hypothetical protein
MFFDVMIASGIAAAVIVHGLRRDLRAGGALVVAFIVIAIYGPLLRLPYAVEAMRDGLSGALRREAAVFAEDLAFMSLHPGQAFCHSPLLCFRARRDFAFDPFNASQAIKLGRVDATPMLDRLARGDFAVVQLSTVEGAHSLGPPGNGGRDAEVEFRRILDQHYRVARTGPRRIFYVPR